MTKHSILFAASLLLACACAPKPEKTAPLADHVIIIGLDGWGSWCMDEGEAPFIRQMMQEGSWTLDKRTVRPSISGPNWAAQLNGTPVEVSGITGNETEPTFKPLYQTEHHEQATLFHLLRQARPDAESGIVCEWGGIQHYVDTLCLNYNKRIRHATEQPEAIVEESVKYIKEAKPVLCFIHIDALDHMGHSFGQGSPEYMAELPEVDGRVQRIVEGIKEAGIYDDSIIILTSDHGHEGTGHGGDSTLEIETPLVIWGKGIRKNHEIKDCVIQYDVAATVAKILNLETPGSWRGIPIAVFE